MPQRVIVISDDAGPSGGAAGIALASIDALVRRGVPVTLLAGEPPAGPENPSAGVDVQWLGGRHILERPPASAAVRGLYDRTTRHALAAWITRNDRPGFVYHLHNWHKVLSPSVLAPLRTVEERLVISAHDYFLVCPTGAYFLFPSGRNCDLTPLSRDCLTAACDKRHAGHKAWRLARHAVRSFLFPLAATRATVLAVHEAAVPLLARGGVPEESIRVLRNPVTPWCEARVPAERNAAVLYVGRLETDKGVETLVRAAARAGAPLHLVGAGPLEAPIRREHPGVTLHGHRPREAVARIARKARLAVFPTRWRETFGLAALEAVGSGIPVIASTASPFCAEIVSSGMGAACDPADENALAAAIARLMADDASVQAMSRAGIAAGPTLAPSHEEWGDRLVALYREILTRTGVPRRA